MTFKQVRQTYNPLFTPVLLFVTALIWLTLGIEENRLALDEPFSVSQAGNSVREIISNLRKGNNPPLYEILLHYWILLFGNSVFSVRFLSVLSGSLLSIVWYHIIKQKTNTVFGLIGFVLILFSNANTAFSHEARVYEIWALITSLSFFFADKWLNAKESSKYLVVFVLSTSILLYLHYLSLFILLSLFIYLLSSGLNIRYLIIAFCLIFLLDIPVFIILFDRFTSGAASELWTQIPSVKHLYGNLNPFFNHPLAAYLLYITLVLVLVLIYIRYNSLFISLIKSLSPFILAFTVPYTLQFLISFKIPVFIPRYTYIYQGIFIYTILFMVSAFRVVDKRFIYLFYPAFAIFLGYTEISADNGRRPDEVAELTRRFEAKYKENGIVCISPEWYKLEFSYYYDSDIFEGKNLSLNLNEKNVYPVWSSDDVHSLIKSKNPEYILHVDGGTELAFGNNYVSTYLSDKSNMIGCAKVDNAVTIFLYRLNPE